MGFLMGQWINGYFDELAIFWGIDWFGHLVGQLTKNPFDGATDKWAF